MEKEHFKEVIYEKNINLCFLGIDNIFVFG